MKIETTLETMQDKDGGDWPYVFVYAKEPSHVPEGRTGTGFTADDVAEVLASAEGENDGADWVAILRLKDGRFAYLEAGCDYTGWG